MNTRFIYLMYRRAEIVHHAYLLFEAAARQHRRKP